MSSSLAFSISTDSRMRVLSSWTSTPEVLVSLTVSTTLLIDRLISTSEETPSNLVSKSCPSSTRSVSESSTIAGSYVSTDGRSSCAGNARLTFSPKVAVASAAPTNPRVFLTLVVVAKPTLPSSITLNATPSSSLLLIDSSFPERNLTGSVRVCRW